MGTTNSRLGLIRFLKTPMIDSHYTLVVTSDTALEGIGPLNEPYPIFNK